MNFSENQYDSSVILFRFVPIGSWICIAIAVAARQMQDAGRTATRMVVTIPRIGSRINNVDIANVGDRDTDYTFPSAFARHNDQISFCGWRTAVALGLGSTCGGRTDRFNASGRKFWQERATDDRSSLLSLVAAANSHAGNGKGAGDQSDSSKNRNRTPHRMSPIRWIAIAVAFTGASGLSYALLSSLPPDFFSRWHKLFDEQPHFQPTANIEPRKATAIYDCHGDLIATVLPGGFSGSRPASASGRGEYQGPLKPQDVPTMMWQAVIASEDRRFFEHQGFDPKGLLRAVASFANTGGGSTITQQVREEGAPSHSR